jgi:hypothetical protein
VRFILKTENKPDGDHGNQAGRRRCNLGILTSFLAVAVAGLGLACGESKKNDLAPQSLVGFTAVAASELNDWRCRYDLSYDRSSSVQIRKTCPDGIDPTGTTNRIYNTAVDPDFQEKLLAALDQLNTRELLSTYLSATSFHSKEKDYNFRFLAEDGNAFAAHVGGGSDETLPAGLLQIYRGVLDGNLRSMRNASEAMASLLSLNDNEVEKTELQVSLKSFDGGGSPGCICDGNDKLYGSDSRSKIYLKGWFSLTVEWMIAAGHLHK